MMLADMHSDSARQSFNYNLPYHENIIHTYILLVYCEKVVRERPRRTAGVMIKSKRKSKQSLEVNDIIQTVGDNIPLDGSN